MDDPRESILDAAEARFSDYGYGKTTMAEIADEAGMSVGNLYRHFKNKEAIAVHCVRRILQAKLDAGRRAAAQREDALDALHVFLQTRLRIGHARYAGTRHQFDMMELIGGRHQALLLEYEERVIDSLTEIIERGMRQGRFADCDAARTAYDIHQATLRYNNPLHLRANALATLEADLARLVMLLFHGLKARGGDEEQCDVAQ